MTRKMIEEMYSVSELRKQKETLKQKLRQSALSDMEKWEIGDLIQLINKRIRLMDDLLIGLTTRY